MLYALYMAVSCVLTVCAIDEFALKPMDRDKVPGIVALTRALIFLLVGPFWLPILVVVGTLSAAYKGMRALLGPTYDEVRAGHYFKAGGLMAGLLLVFLRYAFLN